MGTVFRSSHSVACRIGNYLFLHDHHPNFAIFGILIECTEGRDCRGRARSLIGKAVRCHRLDEGNSRQTSTNHDLGSEGGHPRSDVSVRHLKVDGWEMRNGPQVKWAETLRITEVPLEMMSTPPQIRILKCLKKDCRETLQDD
jgi:hypothetical protein